MENERMRILAMLEEGKITAEQAVKLIDAVAEKDGAADSAGAFDEKQQQDSQQESSADDFFESIRKDFQQAGDRFMQFMDTAVQRVKTFDFDTPFGKSAAFIHKETAAGADIRDIILQIDHGTVEIETSETEDIHLKFYVKYYGSEDETEAREQFLDKLTFRQDGGKLRVESDLKISQVNVKLLVPAKTYRKLSVRLLNGGFSANTFNAEELRIKTANGKIEWLNGCFDEAELETANGMIRLLKVKGHKLEAETLNGRVYIDGELAEVDAKSLNGNVSVTTTSKKACEIEAKSISGAVEIYIPSALPLEGTISSNMGKLDLQLQDVSRTEEQEQFLHKTVRFHKTAGDDTASVLKVTGESKTGSVLVHYNSFDQ